MNYIKIYTANLFRFNFIPVKRVRKKGETSIDSSFLTSRLNTTIVHAFPDHHFYLIAWERERENKRKKNGETREIDKWEPLVRLARMGRLVAGRWPRNCNHHPISGLLSSRCRETVLSVPLLRIYRSSCLVTHYDFFRFFGLLRVFFPPTHPSDATGLISFHATRMQDRVDVTLEMGRRCRWFSLWI